LLRQIAQTWGTNYLRGDFDFIPTADAVIDDVRKQLDQLTQEQRIVLDGRPVDFHPYHGRYARLKELERLITDLRRLSEDDVPTSV
jgi:hypothetical protein